MPGKRPAEFPVNRPRQSLYVMNTMSPDCPSGQGQEETVKAIWSDARYADVTVGRTGSATRRAVPMTEDISSLKRTDQRTLEDLRALYDRYGVE